MSLRWYNCMDGTKSPSSRRAWIEIKLHPCCSFFGWVALLAEGVDRNTCEVECKALGDGRPPRGGRG